MRIIDWLSEILFPSKCVLCGKLLNKDQLDLCTQCRTETKLFPGAKSKMQFLDSVTAVWYYDGNVRRSLLRYKFRGARHYSAAYGRLLAMKIRQTYPEGFDVLTWVPVSAKRRAKRGYDQVELIALAVGEELNMPCTPLLAKIRDNPPQSGLESASLRRANVSGVYCLRKGVDLSGKRILLLDDIITTGATAGEAARMLRLAGALEVHCAAMAAARK